MHRTLFSRTCLRFFLALACLLSLLAFAPGAVHADSTLTVNLPASTLAGQPITQTVTGSAIAVGTVVNVTAYLGQTKIYDVNLTATVAGSVTFTLTPTASGTLTVHAVATLLSAGAATGQNQTAVTDFSLTPVPASLSIAGNIPTSVVTVNAINGFTDTVTLSAAATDAKGNAVTGLTAAFSANPVSAGASSTMTVTAASSLPAGAYTLVVTGADGALTRPAPVSVTVSPSIVVTTNPWTPNPAIVNQIITSPVTATVANPYSSPNSQGDVISQHWDWTTGGVWRSDDGTSGTFIPYTDSYLISWSGGSSATTFSGSFGDMGNYLIEVTATLTFHDDTTNKDIGSCTANGYIGGSASDIAPTPPASPPGSPAAAPQVMSPHQVMQPHDAGTPPLPGKTGNNGVPVGAAISLAGTTLDTSKNQWILVGQGCTASVSGLPATKGGKPIKYSYQWDVKGNTFQSWNGDSGTVPVVAVLGMGPATNATAHWFWNDSVPTKETITCIVAVVPPAGQTAAPGTTLTQTVTVDVPSTMPTGRKLPINAFGVGHVGTYIANSSTIYTFADTTPLMTNNGQDYGSTWTASVSLPPSAPYNGDGKIGYAQLITPGEYVTPDGLPEQGSLDNGVEQLDGVFPYSPLNNPDQAATHITDGNPFNIGDSPALPLADYVKMGALADVISSGRLIDHFKTYLMFQPPPAPSAFTPNDVQWIPLMESDWDTNFKPTRPATGSWKDFPKNTSVGEVGFDTNGFNFKAQNTHPSWTKTRGSAK